MSLLLLLGASGGAPPPPPTPTPTGAVIVRESPPLWLAATVTPPGSARAYRWGGDEPDAANRITGLAFSSSVPGGFEQMSCTLPRLPGVEYSDLDRLGDVVVYGPGGQGRWEGRLSVAPSVSGDQMAVSPDAVGHKAHLEDSRRASMVFIDRDLSRWTGPSAQRRLNLINGSAPHQGDASVSWDTDLNVPALVLAVNGLWTSPIPRCEAWYDAGAGNRIAEIRAEFSGWPDATFGLYASVSDDAVSSTQEQGGDYFTAATGLFDFRPTSRYRYGRVLWRYDTGGGSDGSTYACKLFNLRAHGDHGLTLRTGSDGVVGYFASDVFRYAVQRWAPLLTVTADSIQQTSFVISHLTFPDGATVQAIVDAVTRFGLEDYAVWDRKTVWLYRRGTVGRQWIARVGPSKLREAGPSDDRLFNRLVVRYRDVDGTTRTVGPPGSGCDFEDAALRDDDPENEANKKGIERYAPDVEMQDVSVSGAAIEVGARFLAEARALDQSGNAELVGTIYDDRGVEHPVSAVRGGDTIRFVDARDPSPRRIVRAGHNADTYTSSIDLDAPPQGMEAALARLGLAVVNVG